MLAARHLVRTSGFAAVTVLTLALAIGANTAIFSVVDAMVYLPMVGQTARTWAVGTPAYG